MLLVVLMTKKLLEGFTKKNCKKQIKKSLEWKKYLKKQVINYFLNRKTMIIPLTVGLIKKHSICVNIFQNLNFLEKE